MKKEDNLVVRYSDKDLGSFKKIIEEKISKAQRDLELIRSAYMNDGNNGTEDTSPTFKAFEEGSQTMSKEANTQLAIRQEKFIRDLKNALIRIENKTYGICRVTGKLISKKRLKLVPHATLSIEAKNNISQILSMKINDFLSKMWNDYSKLNPHINQVLNLIKTKEPNEIINDHIALRTFNHKKLNRHVLSEYFLKNGYKAVEDLV